MKQFEELYNKALSNTKSNHLPESINDLLIKELNEEKLSEEEFQALRNYYKFRNTLLSSAINDEDFSNKIKKLRVIANFTRWQEFLNDYK